MGLLGRSFGVVGRAFGVIGGSRGRYLEASSAVCCLEAGFGRPRKPCTRKLAEPKGHLDMQKRIESRKQSCGHDGSGSRETSTHPSGDEGEGPSSGQRLNPRDEGTCSGQQQQDEGTCSGQQQQDVFFRRQFNVSPKRDAEAHGRGRMRADRGL